MIGDGGMGELTKMKGGGVNYDWRWGSGESTKMKGGRSKLKWR